MKMLVKSMNGEESAQEVLAVLSTTYGIKSDPCKYSLFLLLDLQVLK